MSSPGRAGGEGSVLKAGPGRHDDMRVTVSQSIATLDVANVTHSPSDEKSSKMVQLGTWTSK